MNIRTNYFRASIKPILVGLLSLGLAAATPDLVRAQDEATEVDSGEFSKLDDSVNQLANDIKSYLDADQQGLGELAIGAFSGPAQLVSSGGVAFGEKLSARLTELGVSIKKRTRFGLKGEFFFDEDDGKITLKSTLRDKNFVVRTYSTSIFDEEDVLALTGGQGTLDSTNLENRREDLAEAVQAGEAVLAENSAVTSDQIATVDSNTAEAAAGNTAAGGAEVATGGQAADSGAAGSGAAAGGAAAGGAAAGGGAATGGAATGGAAGGAATSGAAGGSAATSGTVAGGGPAGGAVAGGPGGAEIVGAGAKPKTLVLAQAGGKYAVEICVLRDGIYKSLPVIDDEGLAFVDMNPEDLYAIRLINNTDQMAAVTLTIDGLNLFAFSQRPDYKALGKIIIHPRSEGYLIKGWYLNDAQVAQFQVTDAAQSAKAQLLGGPSGVFRADETVGMITASFALAIPAGQPFPVGELAQKSLGTKQGPVAEQRFKEERVNFGLIKEVISVRYSRPLPPGA